MSTSAHVTLNLMSDLLMIIIGHENASRLASEAFHSGQSILELVIKENLLDATTLKELLKPENMV